MLFCILKGIFLPLSNSCKASDQAADQELAPCALWESSRKGSVNFREEPGCASSG